MWKVKLLRSLLIIFDINDDIHFTLASRERIFTIIMHVFLQCMYINIIIVISLCYIIYKFYFFLLFVVVKKVAEME